MISVATLRPGLSPVGWHIPGFFVGRFGIALESIASSTNHCSTPLSARKEKLDAVGDSRIEHARTPGDRKETAQFELWRCIALFVFRIE